MYTWISVNPRPLKLAFDGLCRIRKSSVLDRKKVVRESFDAFYYQVYWDDDEHKHFVMVEKQKKN